MMSGLIENDNVLTKFRKNGLLKKLKHLRMFIFNMRVRSWLRMNAGGVPNTCKSNGQFKLILRMKPKLVSGGRVSNAWGTCLDLGDSSWKRLIIPHKTTRSHDLEVKDLSDQDGPASD